MQSGERQITRGAGGCVLTNTGVWSPDGQWIVYDTRSDTLGECFDGTRIEMASVESGEVRVLYQSRRGACCGVATFDPAQNRVVFILGPEDPTSDWHYGPSHRQGVLVETARPGGVAVPLDARNIVPPFTSGALRGGSHVHVFSTDGQWVSFTYNDHVLSVASNPAGSDDGSDSDQRNIGISVPTQQPVTVPKTHPRNHDGAFFSVLVTRTTAHPPPGSDEITRAFEEGWIGRNGYHKTDGTLQRRAIAFQGEVISPAGTPLSEVFVVDIPEDISRPGDSGPLQGTQYRRPQPPPGTVQRRVTFTAGEKYPGIQGPRHWLRSSPDGSQIAFLRKDNDGIVQIRGVSPNGGTPRPLTRNPWSVASAFTWSFDGKHLAYIADQSVFITEAATGETQRLTDRWPDDADAPLPLACVFSPDGRTIAFQRRVDTPHGKRQNQIFVVPVPSET